MLKFIQRWMTRDLGKTRFLIICAARTGSTMLRLMLNSHPVICCHGEVFSKPLIRGFVGLHHDEKSPILHMLQQLRNKEPVTFLQNFVFYPGPFRTVGAKIQYVSLQEPEWQTIFKTILSDHDIRIVHLTRENRLKRFVSHYIAARITHVNLALTSQAVPPPVRITLSPRECMNDIIATEEAEHRYREYFKNHQVFEITYEQILDLKNSKLAELQRFLGVKPAELKTITLKLNPNNLEELIENYQELKSKFNGTEFERYLSS